MSLETPHQTLLLRFLGEVEIQRSGQTSLPSLAKKGRAILGVLVAAPGVSQSRQRLAEIFWPDLAEDAARNNLRQVLLQMQRIMGDKDAPASCLEADRETIRFNPACHHFLDTEAFSDRLPDCPKNLEASHCKTCIAEMERQAALYRGEFMSSFHLTDCPEFEDWLQIQRESYLRHALLLLERISACCELQGEIAKALSFALRFTELEPWNEDGHRRAMRLAAIGGQRAAALAQYKTLTRTLEAELGVLPEKETQQLADQIRTGEIGPEELSTPPSVTTAVPLLPAIERRQVTVLYCQFSAKEAVDPEDAWNFLRTPQARSMETVETNGGYVVRTNDGGFLAYFGYPRAQENAPLRAVRTAYGLTESTLSNVDIRIGIHTGLILVGNDPIVPDTIGQTSAIAIGLRKLTGGSGVVVSEITRPLISGYFNSISLGSITSVTGLKTEAFKITQASGATHRIAATRTLTPLIGRDNETTQLTALWNAVEKGERKVCLLTGEPGIGKSRLVHTLKQTLTERPCTVLELRSFPETSQSPFHPIATLIAERLSIQASDSPETRFAKLAEYTETHYRNDAAQAIPLLASVLSLPVASPYREPATPLAQQREETMAVLLDRLRALVGIQPTLLIVEDLHWIDPTTLELLTRVLATNDLRSILILFTARPEFVSPWNEKEVANLNISPLERNDIRVLIEAIGLDAPENLIEEIVERADGIPLFAEELARNIAKHQTEPSPNIPSSLMDLLAARLDNLDTAKAVAQLAATIGREFSLDLLQELSPLSPSQITKAIQCLEDNDLIEGSAERDYLFRHALFRDAAYESQTRSGRRESHATIAETLETRFSNIVTAHPEIVARHWQDAGKNQKAVSYWINAGRRAHLHSAEKEAMSHFRAGLALLPSLPEGTERTGYELVLQTGLGASAYAAEGYASPIGWAAYVRAVDLSAEAEADADTFQALWGLWASTSSHSDWSEALKLARRLLQMAERSSDPVQIQQAHFAIGNIQFWRGEFEEAREQLERAISLYEPTHHEALITGYGENAYATSGGYLSWTLCYLGYPNQAYEAGKNAVEEARRAGHPFSLGYALTFFTVLHRMLRRPEETLTLAEETIALAHEHGFPLWDAGATLEHGWARVIQGDPEGLAEMEASVQSVRALMSGITLIFLETLADAQCAAGNFTDALKTIDEAMEVVKRLDDHHVEAELFRLKGACLLGLGYAPPQEIENAFNKAITIAQSQQAKLLELRATTAWTGFKISQGQNNEAKQRLSQIIENITEGYDTPDLQEAYTLLSKNPR